VLKRIKKVFNKKGLTLMELIVSIGVLSIIIVAVSASLTPLLHTYMRANSFAEANTLLDNIATLMLNEINNAVELRLDDADNDFVIRGIHEIEYRIEEGILEWFNEEHNRWDQLLDGNFYGGSDLEMEWLLEDGLVTLTVRLIAEGWELERDYVAKPKHLNNTQPTTSLPNAGD